MDRSRWHCPPSSAPGLRGWLLAGAMTLLAASASAFASEPCGTGNYPFPYTDVASVTDPFCPGIMEAYVTGISKGTSPTTFSPNDDVIRLQMTTFLQRSVDKVLTRSSQRAALNQWWIPQDANAMQAIDVGSAPYFCASDGDDIWTTEYNANQVVRVQAHSGAILGAWTGAANNYGVLAAAGKVFVTAQTSPGSLYVIDPTLSPGPVTVASNALGNLPIGIAFDGTNLWTANNGSPGSVSYITPTSPYTVTTVSTGFNQPYGVLYDGAHIWVSDEAAGTLLKLDASGNVVQTVTVGAQPRLAVFDGANIWVPNFADDSVSVVQASTGKVLATISTDGSNLLNGPFAASFDGERVMVTNELGNSVTVFKAADLSLIGNVTTGPGSQPTGACSDGINFWVDTFFLVRF